MIVNIKKPSYYSKTNEIDIEIIEMYDLIKKFFSDREYSENIRTLDILPVVAPDDKLKQGLWKEEVIFSKSIKRVSVLKHIDYLSYVEGNVSIRKKLTLNCILGAAEDIAKKKSTGFDSKQFSRDLIDMLNSQENLWILNLEEEGININMLLRKFEIRVNNEHMFENRVVSKYSINEAIDYVKDSYIQNEDEFLVLENTESKRYVQCIFDGSSFIIQSPKKVWINRYKLTEMINVSPELTKRIFFDFMNEIDIIEEYQFKEPNNSKSFKL